MFDNSVFWQVPYAFGGLNSGVSQKLVVLQFGPSIVHKISRKRQAEDNFFEPYIFSCFDFKLSNDRCVGNNHEHFHDFIIFVNFILITRVVKVNKIPNFLKLMMG